MAERGTNREIERKYLLRALPAGVESAPSAELMQGYLPGEEIHERIRRVTEAGAATYFRAIKAGSGIDRFECEEETTREFFDAVWPLTRGRRIQKRRYRLASGADLWEVDQFLDRDLALAELELDSVDQRIDMPDVIREVLEREVTDEPEFTNFRLAR